MMAGRFMTAAGESYRALGMRKDARPLDYGLVSWNEAVPGVVVLVLAQAAMLAGSFGGRVMEYLPFVFDLGFVTLVAFAVPLVLVIVWAHLSRQPEKAPLLVMHVALVLLIVQVASLLFSYFGLQTSMALVGVTAVFVGRAIRTVLGASIPMAILAGVLVGAGTAAAGLLILLLPTGQAMLGTA
jgi:hypothetical protein